MNVLALAFVVAAVADVPPPPPLLDPRPTEENAPAPVDPAPLPPIEDEPRVLKPAPRVAPRVPPPSAQAKVDEGFDAFTIGAMQFLVPCGSAIVAVPCGLVSAAAFPPALLCIACGLPAVNGYLATYVGDRFGTQRAAAIWPVLAGYAGLLGAGVVGVGLVYVTLSQQLDGQTANYAALGAAAVLAVGSSLLLPVSYALNAEPKRAGDDGSEPPAWFEPGHARPKKKGSTREPPDAPPVLTAMRF